MSGFIEQSVYYHYPPDLLYFLSFNHFVHPTCPFKSCESQSQSIPFSEADTLLATRTTARGILSLQRSSPSNVPTISDLVSDTHLLQRKPTSTYFDHHGLLEYLWHILLLRSLNLTFRQPTLAILPLLSTTSPPDLSFATTVPSSNLAIPAPVATSSSTAIPATARASTAVWERSQPKQEQGFLCNSRGREESADGLFDEGYGRGGVVTEWGTWTEKEPA